MPSRNVIKEFASQEYYHVYNRGVEKRDIFLDEQDYTVFMGLLKKYLSAIPNKKQNNNSNRHTYSTLNNELNLVAYCLMPNHFHLLFYQHTDDAITKLMRRVITGYVMYFNDRYKRVGTLFQGRYKAAHINADAYLHHISRYIHMNPNDYETASYSSLPFYIGSKKTPEWVKPAVVLELFDNNRQQYHEFLKDYQDTKQELSVLKWQLANDPEDM